MPLVIGVTGAIATGKGLVCQTLVELGAAHCDADILVHRLYDPDTLAFQRIVAIFGQEIVGQDGYIDRKVLGAKVFGRPEKMRKLTQAIGDIGAAIKGAIDQWRITLKDDAIAVLEAVNHVEAGYGQWCDLTWLVACHEDTARRRIMDRNSFTPKEANQRLASQRPWEERAPAADQVFHNNGTMDALITEVKAEYWKVLKLRTQGRLSESRYHAWWKARSLCNPSG